MKKLISISLLILNITTFANIEINVVEKKFSIHDESGAPVEGVILEQVASYKQCSKFYFGTRNACSIKKIVLNEVLTDKEGQVTLPSVKKEIKDSFTQSMKDITYSVSIVGIQNVDLNDDYQDCNSPISFHLKEKSKTCSEFLSNSSTITDFKTDYTCTLTGTRDLGFVNNERVHQEIPLLDAIEDYKKECEYE